MDNYQSLHLKQASLDDCSLIHDMATIVFPHTYNKILSPEQLDYMMKWMYSLPSLKKQMDEEDQTYFIAYYKDEPCGYLSIQPEGKDLYHLQKIYVLPNFQGKSIGKFLFENAIDYIQSIHPTPCKMHLNVNRNNSAKQFYEHMGMHVHSQGDFEIGNGYYMNDYIMEIDIN